MANTVIGFFKHRSEAADAVMQLTRSGINREDIDMSNSTDQDSYTSGQSGTTSGYEGSTSGSTGYTGAGGSTGYTGSSETYGSTGTSGSTGYTGSTSSTRFDDANTDNNNWENDSNRERHGKKDNALTRFFNNLFGDDSDDSRKYTSMSEKADTIVTVHASSRDQAEEAANILDSCGAMDIDESSIADDSYTQTGDQTGGYRGTSDMSGRYDNSNAGNDRRFEDQRNEEKIDVIREDLQVGKRSVETGGVRVRSRIIEKPVEENLRLREEHVRVHRQPVDKAANINDMESFREKEIELTEYSEVPVVNKEARVVEEIRVTKDVNEREETVRETLRETEVDIENDTKRKGNRDLMGSDRDYTNDDMNRKD